MPDKKLILASLGAMLFAAPLPATAKLIDQSEAGFTSAHSARVAASPDDVWKMLRSPQNWWSAQHSWSGNAANFWMDTQAGGCFCEKLPGPDGTLGSVQHARILFAKPGELLRLSGALGPLQSEAVTGTLTIQIKPIDGGGSIIRFDYAVGGYARFKFADIAPVVDSVIGVQIAGLAKALGGAVSQSEAPGDVADEGNDLAGTAAALEAEAKKEVDAGPDR